MPANCRLRIFLPVIFLSVVFSVAPLASAATVEYLDGTRLECKVLSKDETNVTVEVTSGGMTVKRTIPLAKVHKVTINDKIYVINERSTSTNANKASDAPATNKPRRTKAEVEALINELGRKPPDWFEATPLNYPKTLDLSWPEGPPPEDGTTRKTWASTSGTSSTPTRTSGGKGSS